MVRIKVRKGETLEQALRRFNKKVNQANIIKEALYRKEYVKPTEARRERKKQKKRKIYLDNLRR